MRPLKESLSWIFIFKWFWFRFWLCCFPEDVIYCDINEKDQFTMSTAHKIGGVLVHGQILTENLQQYETGFISSLFQRLSVLFI